MLTAEEVRALLNYDLETGMVTWRIDLGNGKPKAGDIAGTVVPKGHRRIYIRGCWYQAHRLIWLMQTGQWPARQVDHRDTYGPKRDFGNRWENLRLADNAENGRNRKRNSNNTSGVPGVTWHRGIQKWVATIRADREKIALGSYRSLDEAAAVRCAAEIKYFGEFAPSGVAP